MFFSKGPTQKRSKYGIGPSQQGKIAKGLVGFAIFAPKKLSQAHLGLAGTFTALLVGGYGAWAVSSKNQCTFTLRRVVEKNGYFTGRLTVEGGGVSLTVKYPFFLLHLA